MRILDLHRCDSVVPAHDVDSVTTILAKDVQGHRQPSEQVFTNFLDREFAHGTPHYDVLEAGQRTQKRGAGRMDVDYFGTYPCRYSGRVWSGLRIPCYDSWQKFVFRTHIENSVQV